VHCVNLNHLHFNKYLVVLLLLLLLNETYYSGIESNDT